MGKSKSTPVRNKLSFKDLPEEIGALFVQRTIIDAVLSAILIIISTFLHIKGVWLISIVCILFLWLLHGLFYWKLCNTGVYILEAECVTVKKSDFKLTNSDSKYELLLRNDTHYYTVHVSRQTAKSLSEGMALRVYVFENNAYQKNSEYVVLMNPILITPIISK